VTVTAVMQGGLATRPPARRRLIVNFFAEPY